MVNLDAEDLGIEVDEDDRSSKNDTDTDVECVESELKMDDDVQMKETQNNCLGEIWF